METPLVVLPRDLSPPVIELPIRDGNKCALMFDALATIVIELPIRDGNKRGYGSPQAVHDCY